MFKKALFAVLFLALAGNAQAISYTVEIGAGLSQFNKYQVNLRDQNLNDGIDVVSLTITFNDLERNGVNFFVSEASNGDINGNPANAFGSAVPSFTTKTATWDSIVLDDVDTGRYQGFFSLDDAGSDSDGRDSISNVARFLLNNNSDDPNGVITLSLSNGLTLQSEIEDLLIGGFSASIPLTTLTEADAVAAGIVPVPAGLILLASGFLGLIGLRRRA